MRKQAINVTQPSLPPLEEFIPLLEQIWLRRQLTNNGPFHHQLEEALCEYLGVKYISLFNNGTIALITALKALGLKGKVITTPFSFAATSHSLVWNNLEPVFVDIDPETLNLDPAAINNTMLEEVSAILPVHCFGIPCDVEKISSLAERNNIKVIYDAAHTFGVTHRGKSLSAFGDVSILSFHATKVFNTLEGGAVICHDSDFKYEVDKLKNFGIESETEIPEIGINGKLNEVSAALGVLQLKYIDEILLERSRIVARYINKLDKTKGVSAVIPSGQTVWNYSYMPVLIQEDYPLSRDELYFKLKAAGINGRRYFFPLLSHLPAYRNCIGAGYGKLPVAEKIAASIICLPLFTDMTLDQVDQVVAVIMGNDC